MRGRCIGWVLGIGLLACVLVVGGAPRSTVADDEPPGKKVLNLFVPVPESQRPPGFKGVVERWRAKPRTESLEIGYVDDSVLNAARGPLEFQVRLFDREWIQAPLSRRRSGARRVRAFATPRAVSGDRATLTIVEGTEEAPPKGLLVAHRSGRILEIRWTGASDVGGRMMYAARLVRPRPNRPEAFRPESRRWPRPDPWRPCAWRDDGSCFDVLVGYTTQVLDNADGDPDNILADVSESVINTEVVFANSGILTSIRIVGILPTDISEMKPPVEDAAPEQRTHEELLDIATAHRGLKIARYCLRADFATLLVESGARWGLAHVWRNPLVNFAPRAYSVIVRLDAVFTYAMAHELGHNMGCAHDTLTDTHDGLYMYSHGYQWNDPPKGWTVGTVMSYGSESLAIYSTPDETYPLGDPSGTPVGHALRSHNVRTIVKNRVRIANWGNQLARPW